MIIAQEKPLNIDEASKYLNMKKSYLYQLTSRKQIPHYKPTNGKIYFKRIELDNWAYSNYQKTEDQLESEAANYHLRRNQSNVKWIENT